MVVSPNFYYTCRMNSKVLKATYLITIGLGLAFIMLIASLSSCKKCADCTVTVTQKVTGQPATTGTSTTELCGDDLKEADGNTTTAQSTVNGYTAVVTTKTECN